MITTFRAWITPKLEGKLVYVSADRLLDQRTGLPYYDARIEADRRELERLDEVHLCPGMQVQAMMVTDLTQPLLDSFSRAFRED
jgi:HlyD family secretion protein